MHKDGLVRNCFGKGFDEHFLFSIYINVFAYVNLFNAQYCLRKLCRNLPTYLHLTLCRKRFEYRYTTMTARRDFKGPTECFTQSTMYHALNNTLRTFLLIMNQRILSNTRILHCFFMQYNYYECFFYLTHMSDNILRYFFWGGGGYKSNDLTSIHNLQHSSTCFGEKRKVLQRLKEHDENDLILVVFEIANFI